MWTSKPLAARAGFVSAALLAAFPAFAQAPAGDGKLTSVPAGERLTLSGVFADASIVMKVVLWGLVATLIAGLVVWLVQAVRLSQRRSDGAAGGVAYLSAQAAAAPLFGLFGMAYALTSGFIGIANVRPVPNLTVLAPGLAEASLSLGLGLLAAAIAVVGHRHLKAKLYAAEQAEAAPAAPRPAPMARAVA